MKTIGKTIMWILVVLTIGYLLPTGIAVQREKANALAIGILNLLTGWTFIGWVAALVWALTKDHYARTA